MANKNEQKSLSEVFRELERDKDRQVQFYKKAQKAKQESSFMFQVKHRTKKDNVLLVLIVLIVLFTFSLFSRNYIFAVSVNNDPKNKIGTFEKNENPKDVYQILSENISSVHQKEIFDQEEDINFETRYIYNKDVPEGEETTLQEGIIGKKIVTYVTSYENGQVISQDSIGERLLQNSQEEIIEVGTSKLLKDYNIHIGDNLYCLNDVGLKKTIDINSEDWVIIPKFFDVKTKEIIDEAWIKVSFDKKYTGYIQSNLLTSETLTPGIEESSRQAKIINNVDITMELNTPSGLLPSDYERILGNQPSDTNNVFKENYRAFYDAEQKYGINGVFLASIAIHESGWGKSSIAVQKHNLFGFGAYDNSPFESAVTFATYSDGIDVVASWLASNYLNTAGTLLKTGEIASRYIL